MDKKTKALQTPFRVMGRSFEQPSPEVFSQLAYVLISTAGMAPACHGHFCGQHGEPSGLSSAARHVYPSAHALHSDVS
jgi:hypothetical protein